ncbi:MAG: hypothetical protein JST42_04925 [Bacteroidetes bacterium]|nr:hypothetical protein [Bacteroidota bacterium]
MKMVRFFLIMVGFLFLHGHCKCQVKNDTTPSFIKGKPATGYRVTDTLPRGPHPKGHKQKVYQTDSLGRRIHNPRKATLYSTFCPGLGQIYNRKYWKLPLVYAAVGIPAYTFFYNRNWYRKTQQAIALIDPYVEKGDTIPASVAPQVDPRLRSFVEGRGDVNSLRTYRNEFRKDQDYSVLFFLLFWGLQIVDATVDAHLMSFDVSDKLSLQLQQPPAVAGPGAMGMGVGLAFDFHKPRYKQVKALP